MIIYILNIDYINLLQLRYNFSRLLIWQNRLVFHKYNSNAPVAHKSVDHRWVCDRDVRVDLRDGLQDLKDSDFRKFQKFSQLDGTRIKNFYSRINYSDLIGTNDRHDFSLNIRRDEYLGIFLNSKARESLTQVNFNE